MSASINEQEVTLLIQEIENLTGEKYSTLDEAIQALKEVRNKTNNSNGIVDVAELPTTNINENVVYRINEKIQISQNQIYVFFENSIFTIQQFLNFFNKDTILEVYVVDELTNLKPSDKEKASFLNLYILRNNGICYLRFSETDEVISFGDAIAHGTRKVDHGFTENPYAETEVGIYTTLEDYKNIARYFVYKNNEWEEISSTQIVNVNN